MTYASLKTLLSDLLPGGVFETAAPAGETRFIVHHCYGTTPVYADDTNIWEFPRVQLDIYTRDPDDELPGQVKQLLRAWATTWSVQYMGWDDETGLYRVILQLEVLGL